MRILRAAVAVVAALALTLLGLAALAHGRPTVSTVYDTDFRGPKVTVDGVPRVERAPQFRVLVGGSRKTARWIRVNPAQYASCAKGDRWNGVLCSKGELDLPAATLGARQSVLVVIGLAMVAVPLAVAATSGGRRG